MRETGPAGEALALAVLATADVLPQTLDLVLHPVVTLPARIVQVHHPAETVLLRLVTAPFPLAGLPHHRVAEGPTRDLTIHPVATVVHPLLLDNLKNFDRTLPVAAVPP